MNQQRARRFRSAKDAKDADEKKAEFQSLLRQQRSEQGEQESSTEEVVKKTWDSNVITPGTPFMFILAQSVRYWCQWKLNTDPAWADIKVIISDASVPGEGEHKIMQFIRSQRSDPEYDPNTRHVMYGLDADLIMLGLATHEPHFRILREDVFAQDAKAKTCKICGQPGHYADQCRGTPKEKSGEFDEKAPQTNSKPYIWLSVSILREYLSAEMYVPGQNFRFDLERAIDDWVFMCFFVGNDFLPHLPSLDIHEDGIDKLIAIWRDNIPVMGGYLTCDGTVDLSRAQVILQGLSKQEDAIFRRRKEAEDRKERNQQRRKQQDEERNARQNPQSNKRRRSSPDYSKGARSEPVPTGLVAASSLNVQVDYNMIVNRGAVDKALASNKSAAAALKEQMLAKKNGDTPTKNGTNGTEGDATPQSALGKRGADLMEQESDSATPGRNTPVEPKQPAKFDPDNPPPDTVRLWEEGYVGRYYEQKFHVSPDDVEFRHKVARSYVEGLAWVLLYYFQGCPSWTWYYPYHYAPFAADFADLDKMTVKFDKGKPFKPYEQLMGVLPAASNHAIPKVFHPLMTEEDSSIIDFYPEDFDLDMNGKKQEWKAVVLLPFIDEKRLLAAMDTKYPQLTDDERQRNEPGHEALIVSDKHPLYDTLAMEFYSKKAKGTSKQVNLPTRKGRLAGSVSKNPDFLPHMHLVGPEDDIQLDIDVDDDRSMSVFFTMPPPTHVHKSMLFPGVQMPPAALDATDLQVLKSKARSSGRDFGGAPLYDNTRRDPMDRRNEGKISYRADVPAPGYGQPPPFPMPGANGQDNPFAAFIDPKVAASLRNGIPPPGFPPPPPPGWNGQTVVGAPPPQRQNGYGRQGGYDQYRSSQQPPQDRYGGGYGQGQGGYQNGGRGPGDGYYGGQNQGRRDDHRGASYGGGYYGQNGGYGGRR
jgi:5'-3' exoribonuclease 2